LGIGDWGLGVWAHAQNPITKNPNPKAKNKIILKK